MLANAVPKIEKASTDAQLLRAAKDAYQANAWTQAREAFLALANSRYAFDAALGLSRIAYKQRDWQTLLQQSATGLSKRPFTLELLSFQARAQTHLRDWENAASAWKKVASQANSSEAWFQLARAHCRAGQRMQALDAASRLKALGDPASLARLLRLAVEMDDFRQVEEIWSELSSCDPAAANEELAAMARNGKVHFQALIAARGGQLDEKAREDLIKQALQQAMDFENTAREADAFVRYQVLSFSAADQLPFRDAAARVLRALQQRVSAAMQSGLLLEMRDGYLKLLTCLPDDPAILVRYAGLMSDLGNFEEAVLAWKLLISRAPANPEYLRGLAVTLDHMGDIREGLSVWQKFLSVSDSQEARRRLDTVVPRLYRLAREAQQAGHLQDAFNQFTALAELQPQHECVQARLRQVGRSIAKEISTAYKARDFAKIVFFDEAVRALFPDSARLTKMMNKAWAEVRSSPQTKHEKSV